jgi:hypothetical protein
MGLYYPYVHFRYKTWLKVAALYWPKIARIVPAGYPIHDDSITQALIDGLDFVVNIPPDSGKAEAGRLMTDALVAGGRQLRGQYQMPSDWLMDAWTRSKLATDNWADGLQLVEEAVRLRREGTLQWSEPWVSAAMRAGRVTRVLRNDLVRENMAINDGPWMAVHPKWAWVYMCVLAEQIAKNNNLSPVTDQVLAHARTNGWTSELIIKALRDLPPSYATEQTPETAIGMLAVQLVVPAHLSNVPIQKIIHLRQRYGADFDAFHDVVAAVAAELSDEFMNIADQAVLEAYLGEVMKRHFERPLADLRKALRGLGIDTAFAAANMKFALPAALVMSGGIAAHQPVIAGAGAAAFGVLTLGRTARLNLAERTKASAASYLWRVERGITPESMIKSLLHRKG